MMKYIFTLLLLTALPSAAVYAQFSPLCTGVTNGFVVDFAVFEGQVHTTGFFKKVCGANTNWVAKWNGTAWEKTALGGIAEGHALEVIDDALFIASYEFGVDSNYVLRWNGTDLVQFGTAYRSNPNPNLSQTASIYDIISYNNEIIVCGEFTQMNGLPTSGIARWNGVKWDSLGPGLGGFIPGDYQIMYPHQLLVFEDDLLVCGNFRTAGDKEVMGIARWNGNQWSEMDAGFNGPVYGMGIFNGVLYAGGSFTQSGNTVLGGLAYWNGSSWQDPGFKLEYGSSGAIPFIHTLKQMGDSLFVAGGFSGIRLADGSLVPASGLVVLNAAGHLNTLGGGTPGKEIEALLAFDDKVWVGGGGANNSGYIATWSPLTSSWQSLGFSNKMRVFPNPASDILHFETTLNTGFSSLKTYDLQGKLLLKTKISQEQTSIDISALPRGACILVAEGSSLFPPLRQVVILN